MALMWSLYGGGFLHSPLEVTEYFSSIGRLLECIGKPNVADFFPILRWLDPQCIKKNVKRDMGNTFNFSSAFVKERLLDRQMGKENPVKDYLDVILDFQGIPKDGEPTEISENNINIMILELFSGAVDTTSSTIEWAMTESIMKILQDELDRVVGQNKKVEESNIGKLPYLQAVVKETLRLHPPVPLLIPRKALEDTKFMGYSIPKDTQIFVNAWAIGRDPVSWENPVSFKPERFLRSSIDYKGQHFQLIPFGAGRRMCAGLTLAHRNLHLAIGSLIHSFEWALPNGITVDKMDMREKFGITLRKEDPLKVMAYRRSCTCIPTHGTETGTA